MMWSDQFGDVVIIILICWCDDFLMTNETLGGASGATQLWNDYISFNLPHVKNKLLLSPAWPIVIGDIIYNVNGSGLFISAACSAQHVLAMELAPINFVPPELVHLLHVSTNLITSHFFANILVLNNSRGLFTVFNRGATTREQFISQWMRSHFEGCLRLSSDWKTAENWVIANSVWMTAVLNDDNSKMSM